jgi:hypothetical protein
MQSILLRTILLWLGIAELFASINATRAAESSWAGHPENVWIRQSPREGVPAPGFYYEGSGGFDPYSNQWIHHAGHDGIPQGFHTFRCDLASGKWQQLFPATSPPGVCCVDGANVFDVAHRRFVRFPGGSLGHGYQWSRGVRLKESAVWLFDPVDDSWRNMRPPPYREPEKYSKEAIGGLCSGGTYAAKHELAISFGGTGAGGAKNSLFFYDAYANALYLVQASNAPPARDGMGLTYDPVHDKLVMFGSQYLNDERTWLYDFRLNRWEAYDLDPHPPGKKSETYSTIPKMAYDPIHKVALCVVWLGESGHETWAFDPEKLQWAKLKPAVEPSHSKSRSRNLTFSPEQNLFILELSSTNNRPELWTYRYGKPNAPERPAAPANLEVLTDSAKVSLTWKAGFSPRIKGYRVYRAEPAQPWLAGFKRIGTTSEANFEDKDVSPGKAYFYTVKAVATDGVESESSFRARAQPRVALQPIVSVVATNRVEINWAAHSAKDVVGYNVYRGVVSVKTVKKGEPAAWKDNDPEYAEPTAVKVTDITHLTKLNAEQLRATSFSDTVDLRQKGIEAADYNYAVYAYIVRAVNKLGVESGPSPYALTLPSEPTNFLCREDGESAELKWDANPEKGIAGYRIYKLKGTWEIVPVTAEPLRETRFIHKSGRNATRYWVVAVDALGQEGQPSSPAWSHHDYRGFYAGEWHQ